MACLSKPFKYRIQNKEPLNIEVSTSVIQGRSAKLTNLKHLSSPNPPAKDDQSHGQRPVLSIARGRRNAPFRGYAVKNKMPWATSCTINSPRQVQSAVPWVNVSSTMPWATPCTNYSHSPSGMTIHFYSIPRERPPLRGAYPGYGSHRPPAKNDQCHGRSPVLSIGEPL